MSTARKLVASTGVEPVFWSLEFRRRPLPQDASEIAQYIMFGSKSTV